MKNLLRAVDVGFGAAKAMADGKQIFFPSVTAQFKPIRFSTGLENREITERLCVEYDGRRLFMGDIARKQGTAMVTLSPERFAGIEGMALMFASLALLADSKDETVNLVTGLPVSDFSTKREGYEKALLGRHEIRLLKPDGGLLEYYRINVAAVKVLPQPAGSFFHQLLDAHGQLINRYLAAGNVGILDIGANTIDLARFDKLDFIDDESESFSDLGMFEVFKALSRLIKETLGIEIRPAELEPYVKTGAIPFKGEMRSIITEKKQVYMQQAEKIVSRALNVWRDAWQLNRIFITGGGAMPMGEFLIRQFGDQRQVEICPNGTFTNCSGYMRYGKRTWGK